MDKKKIVVKTSIYKELWEKVESYAQRHDEDIDTALRKLLAKGLFEETKRRILENYQRGRITLREMAELLGVDYWEAQDILSEEGIPLINLPQEEIEKRIKDVNKECSKHSYKWS